MRPHRARPVLGCRGTLRLLVISSPRRPSGPGSSALGPPFSRCYLQQWTTRGRRILLDGADNLYVDGYLDTETSEENMLIAKYSSAGTRKWVRAWHDTGKDDDGAGGLALGSSRVLFVAGTGWAKGDYQRAVAMRINR
jgi:hypothetical protein